MEFTRDKVKLSSDILSSFLQKKQGLLMTLNRTNILIVGNNSNVESAVEKKLKKDISLGEQLHDLMIELSGTNSANSTFAELMAKSTGKNKVTNSDLMDYMDVWTVAGVEYVNSLANLLSEASTVMAVDKKIVDDSIAWKKEAHSKISDFYVFVDELSDFIKTTNLKNTTQNKP